MLSKTNIFVFCLTSPVAAATILSGVCASIARLGRDLAYCLPFPKRMTANVAVA